MNIGCIKFHLVNLVVEVFQVVSLWKLCYSGKEAVSAKNKNEWMGITHIVSHCLMHQHLPKPLVKALISAYPICLSRQSAEYHMKLLYKDQQSGTLTKSAMQYS